MNHSGRAAWWRRSPDGVGVFTAGGLTFALEILGPRRIAPLVGTSVSSMTAAIAVVLVGAAVGAAIAGRVADRGASRRAEGFALAMAGLGIALGTSIARPAIETLASGGSVLVRALVGSASLLLLPSVALGAVPVLAARRAIAARPSGSGVLGRLSATGTAGGLVGLFGVDEVLLPRATVTGSLLGLATGALVVGCWFAIGPDTHRGPARPASGPAGTAPSPPPLAPLLAASACIGFAILAIEVVAARRICALVGSSLEAWVASLSVVLLALALGAALAADGAPMGRPIRRLSRFGGAAVLLALLDHHALAATLALPGLASTVRVFLGGALAYGPALVLLGSIGPRIGREAARGRGAGRRLALVSIASTLGALLATLATAPLLLPALRSEGVLALAAAIVAATAAWIGRESRTRFALSLAPALVAAGVIALSPATLRSRLPTGTGGRSGAVRFDVDGPYARVGVVDVPDEPGSSTAGEGARRLSIDARIHGVIVPAHALPARSPYIALANAVVERIVEGVPAPSLLVLGGGAYAEPRAFLEVHPRGSADVVELDPAVTAAARATLGLAEDPRMDLVEGDARAVLALDARLAPAYDVVFVDAFGDVSIPWTLTTVEFAREAKGRLRPRGALVVNAIDAMVPGRLVAALRATLRAVFAHVEVVGYMRDDARLVNFVFVASDVEHTLGDLVRDTPDGPVPVVRYGRRELDALERRVGAVVLSDDFAPVEHLVADNVARTMGR